MGQRWAWIWNAYQRILASPWVWFYLVIVEFNQILIIDVDAEGNDKKIVLNLTIPKNKEDKSVIQNACFGDDLELNLILSNG